MKIQTHKNWYEEEPNLEITLDKQEDAWEIAECIKAQYPNTRTVIKCGWQDEEGIHIGLLFVGLNLRGLKLKKEIEGE